MIDSEIVNDDIDDLTPQPRIKKIPSHFSRAKSQLAKYYIESYLTSKMHELKERSQMQKSLVMMKNHKNEYVTNQSNIWRLERRNIKPAQFEKLKIIGRGAYGDVWLVRDKEDLNIYAMKILRKSDLIARQQIMNTLSEREIMASDNPWSVKLIYSFQDKTNLYFVMEYLPGGDLMNLLIKKNYLPENETKFILAELLLSIHNVHVSGFIHRDVKPDNILFTNEGHIKLADFGLSAKIERDADPYMILVDDVNRLLREDPRNSTPSDFSSYLSQVSNKRRSVLCSTVGTPDYIAPEVLLKMPYDSKIDFWSFGIVMYETLFGSPPFVADTPSHTAMKIVRWRETLRFPRKPQVSNDAIDLIRHLLCGKDHRMNFEEIKNHSFFNGIDFDNILNTKPPQEVVPKIKSEIDTSNFDEFEPRINEKEFDISEKIQDEAFINLAFLGFKYNRKLLTRTAPILSPSFEMKFENDFDDVVDDKKIV